MKRERRRRGHENGQGAWAGTCRQIVVTLLAGAIVALGAAPPAQAAKVSCGQQIIADTKVSNDLKNCPDDGLAVDEDGVTLDLNGHTIDGTDNGVGMRMGDGVNRVTVKNGTIKQFERGVMVPDQSDVVRLMALTVVENSVGIVGFGDDLQVVDSTASRNDSDGIFVSSGAEGTLVKRDVANDNGEDGIQVADPATTLGANIANDNEEVGINAVDGVTDLGGNEASGNGKEDCVNVECDAELAANEVSGPDGSKLYVDQTSIGGRCDDSRSAVEAANPSTPWCTLKKALSSAEAGNTVVVRAATYARFDAKDFHRGGHVSFVPHDGESPAIKEVAIERSDHLALQGLRIMRARVFYSSELEFVGNDVTSGGLFAYFSDHLSFEQNKLHDVNDGIVIKKSSDVSIQNNEFKRIPTPSRTSGGDGIQAGDVKRVLISGNLFEQFRAIPHSDAIEFARSNADVTIQNNRFHNCRGMVVVTGTTGSVINTGWLIINNEFTKVRQWGVRLLNFDAVRIINNTVWDAGSYGIHLAANVKRAVIVNNIASKLVASTGMIETEDYNLIAAGYRQGAHDLALQPRFVNAANLDFHLAGGSPGIDAGTSDHGAPVADLEGKPRVDALDVPNTGGGPLPFYDMGAYEFQN